VERSRLIKVAQGLFVVVVVAAFVKVGADNAGELREVDLRIRWWQLLLAVPAAMAAAPLLPLGWRRIVQATGHEIGRRDAIRTWYVGQTARYLPTGLVAVASRAVLVARFGVPQAVTVATVIVEMGTIVLVGGGLAGAMLPSSELPGLLRVAIATGALVALLAVPVVLRHGSSRVARLAPAAPEGWSTRALYESELVLLLNGLAKGLVFALFAGAVLPVRWGDVFLLMGAFHAATTVGTIGITPAGLGVREGALAAILAARFGLGDAAALAVVARVWDTAIELIWLGFVHVPWFRRGLRSAELDVSGTEGGPPSST
jgi:uncharacterized membrane protein YbhN (UPF0104 family)